MKPLPIAIEHINPDNLGQFLIEKVVDFKSLREMKKALKKYKNVDGSKVSDGFFASYIYDYSLDYDFDILKYFDFFPLTLFFNKTDSNHIFGINFHHLPLLTRNWLLWRIQLLNPQAFKTKGVNKINISYAILKGLMRKSKAAVRQYRIDRMSDIRLVDNKDVSELCKYAPETYHAVNFTEVVTRYKNYK